MALKGTLWVAARPAGPLSSTLYDTMRMAIPILLLAVSLEIQAAEARGCVVVSGTVPACESWKGRAISAMFAYDEEQVLKYGVDALEPIPFCSKKILANYAIMGASSHGSSIKFSVSLFPENSQVAAIVNEHWRSINLNWAERCPAPAMGPPRLEGEAPKHQRMRRKPTLEGVG